MTPNRYEGYKVCLRLKRNHLKISFQCLKMRFKHLKMLSRIWLDISRDVRVGLGSEPGSGLALGLGSGFLAQNTHQ